MGKKGVNNGLITARCNLTINYGHGKFSFKDCYLVMTKTSINPDRVRVPVKLEKKNNIIIIKKQTNKQKCCGEHITDAEAAFRNSFFLTGHNGTLLQKTEEKFTSTDFILSSKRAEFKPRSLCG